DLAAWVAQLTRIAQTYPLGWGPTTDGLLAPQYVISRLAELVGPNGIFVGGVGQHQMWASQFLRFEEPRTWIASGGLGT
ncbi:MAG: thiamine pyrophosphate-dependent enzyme, partial [Propionibacteriaceae bacterium]|nr:thiamine pyrophosphate-dependent enzyme [Propionibacteriaceae bacterium]